MAVLQTVAQTVGIMAALSVIALMAFGPTLVELNDRFPPDNPSPRKASVRPAHHPLKPVTAPADC